VGPEIARFIRAKSESGQLATAGDILETVTAKCAFEPDSRDPQQFETLLSATLKENDDLREISDGRGGVRYYSSKTMAEPYAAILARKSENPVALMAEVIRENSQKYPRPVPIELFEGPPFDLTADEILSCLKEMAGSADYQDIAQTTSSIGTVFLFSRLYLEPDYASMLAEWIDVGQAKSP
jgi:hypothetical protein